MIVRFLTSPYLFILIIFALIGVLATSTHTNTRTWEFQSIDTMKYSRDLAREKLNDESFDAVIEKQVSEIANTGANYIAIATPYDDEFTPMLKRWVRAARRHNLKIWFRGNFSGWEQWFGYDKIDQQTHIAKTRQFILDNSILFQDGDIFTSCPECENGEKIDIHDQAGFSNYRNFLITEYGVTKDAFKQIGKKVKSNYYSMNGTIAFAMMDKETTKAFDGVVVVDHYVRDPKQMAADIRQLAAQSGGKVILGEFGAPIPDIHGAMTDEEQAAWMQESLEELSQIKELEGVNYWVNAGGSTAIWDKNDAPKPAVNYLTKFYTGSILQGKIVNESGLPIKFATIQTQEYEVHTDKNGMFHTPYIFPGEVITISASRYVSKTVTIQDPYQYQSIVLEKQEDSLFSLFFKEK